MRLPSVPTPRDVLELATVVPRLLERAAGALDDVGALLERIEATRARAEEVVEAVSRTQQRGEDLLARLEPPLTVLQPTLERLAETTDPREVDALVELIDRLPMLAEKMESDIVPILDSMSTVSPDLHDLLDVSRELNEMLAKLPGMGRVKKRVDEQQAAEGRG